MTVEFIPNDPAPSDAENTVYNVYLNDKFVGYVCNNWMGYWWFYVDGKKVSNANDADRKDLFQTITELLDS